jgi:nucleoside-diphosphate-sugar epimerase
VSAGPGIDPFQIGVQMFGLLDISRARAELGYEPRLSLEEAIRDYVELLNTVARR